MQKIKPIVNGVILPIFGILISSVIKTFYEPQMCSQMMYEKASQVATDAVGSIRTVASFSAEEKIMQLYKKKCDGPMKTGIWQGLISGIGLPRS